MLTADAMRDALWLHIRITHKTQRVAALHWGVSEAFVSAVVRGKKSPNSEMLRDIGLCKVVVYAQL